jgi:hypothetical protein
MKKNAITLPVNFDDGSSREVAITADDPNGAHYSLMIGNEPAGSMKFSADKNEWTYLGELSQKEQRQIAGFIQNYTDDDWEN